MSEKTIVPPGAQAAIDQAFTIIVLAVKAAHGAEPFTAVQAVEVIDGQVTVLRTLLSPWWCPPPAADASGSR
jgi:hypothetical protein